ncbi:MAG: hypothetical protein J6N56_01810 [Bacteroidales bacterium]|nr:hypothetical protein [Bacteroidales bacterium]
MISSSSQLADVVNANPGILSVLERLNKEIADKLNLSVHTVTTHRKNISKKTGINSISGLTVYAIINKLIVLNDLNNQ